jgi:hypothetical protein
MHVTEVELMKVVRQLGNRIFECETYFRKAKIEMK